MSFGSNKGSSNSSSDWESNPWDPASDDLLRIIGEAGGIYDQFSNQDAPSYNTDWVAGMFDQGATLDRAAEYVDPRMVDQMTDANQQMLGQSFAGIDTAATGGGNMGSSRAGLAQGSAAAGASSNLNQQLTSYYDQQLDRAIGDRDSAITAGFDKIDRDFASAEGAQNQGWNNLNSYAQLIGSIAGLGGSGSGNESSNSSNSNFGFQLSDETTKKNIKDTGETATVKKTGGEVPIKEYEYTDEAKKDFDAPSGKQRGVLAQDVEKEDPTAVKESSGKKKKKKKKVNYGALEGI